MEHDKKDIFKFAPIQSETGQQLLEKYRSQITDSESVILIEDNQAFDKSTAIFKISKHLNGFIKHSYYLIFIPKFIRDFFYDIIAKSRYMLFGKKSTCRIPTEKEKNKFL